MKEALNRAIEGGWNSNRYIQYPERLEDGKLVLSPSGGNTGLYKTMDVATAFLDPLFWQALGKAMVKEWGETTFYGFSGETDPTWLVQWHHFIDHIASGGSADEFFDNLLKS